MNTRLMTKLFSEGNEELKENLSEAIDTALESGSSKVVTDKDDISLNKVDDSTVEVTDNTNKETTVAEVKGDDVKLSPKDEKTNKYCKGSKTYTDGTEDTKKDDPTEEVPVVSKKEGEEYTVETKDSKFSIKGFSAALKVARQFSESGEVKVDLTNVDGSNIEPEKKIDKDLGVIDNGEKSGTLEHRSFSEALDAAEKYVNENEGEQAKVKGPKDEVYVQKKDGKICYSLGHPEGTKSSRKEVLERNEEPEEDEITQHDSFCEALDKADEYVKESGKTAKVEGPKDEIYVQKRYGRVCYSLGHPEGTEITRHEVVERNEGTIGEPEINSDPEEGVTDTKKNGTKAETEIFSDDITETVDNLEKKAEEIEESKDVEGAKKLKGDVDKATDLVTEDKDLSKVKKYSMIQRLKVFSQIADSVIEDEEITNEDDSTDSEVLKEAQKSFSNALSYNSPYKVFATSDQIKQFSDTASNPCLKAEF